MFGKITAVKNGSNQAITDTSSLAFLNPLRYRGYVYDDETSLYYLQSRYYDPVTGRFINADVYVDTETGSPLSTNMFAYCENNMLYRIDTTGSDAAWIQAESSVFYQGHTSVLIQERKNWWWYFYWSDDTVQLIFLPASDLKQLNKRVERTLEVCSKLYNTNIKRTDYYNKSLVFKGNFSQSLKLVKNKISALQGKSYVSFYSFAFDPTIEDSEYDNMIKSVSKIKAALKRNVHRYHEGKQRPFSIILEINKSSRKEKPIYRLLSYNCMDVSAETLAQGSLSNGVKTKPFRECLKNV